MMLLLIAVFSACFDAYSFSSKLWKQHVSLPHQGDTHRISRHAMSLFNCDWFEEY
jgi:hypothetical protein